MNTPSIHLPRAKSSRTAFLVSNTLRSDPFEGGFRRFGSFRPGARQRGLAGATLLEVTIALVMLAMMVVASIQALLVSNRLAASNRIRTAARAIVQRNIDTTLTVRFDSTATPGILALTSGANYDDDGKNDNLVDILTLKDTAGTMLPVVKGTLQRTVTAVSNPQGADIRRVEFSLSYLFQGKPTTVSMSTVRTIDD